MPVSTSQTDPRIDRFHAYATTFEAAHESDDWSVLAPYFTEDAISELNGARVEGRGAVLASFRDSVTTFDRRFDSRHLHITHGPIVDDERVHIVAGGTVLAGRPGSIGGHRRRVVHVRGRSYQAPRRSRRERGRSHRLPRAPWRRPQAAVKRRR